MPRSTPGRSQDRERVGRPFATGTLSGLHPAPGALAEIVDREAGDSEVQRELVRLLESPERELRSRGLRIEAVSESGPARLEIVFSTELLWRSPFGSQRSGNFLMAGELVPAEDGGWEITSFWILDGRF